MADESIVQLIPAPFVPSISFGGQEPRYIIRGSNLWLKSKAEGSLYARAYKGSLDIGEPIPTKPLTGTIAWNTGEDVITGTGTAFRTQIRTGTFLVTDTTPSEFFVVEQVISDTQAIVSRAFTTTQAGVAAEILPVMFPVGHARGTAIRGKVLQFPRGHFLGTGDGQFLLNGLTPQIRQIEIMTVLSGASAADGNITVTSTASGLTGSPIATNVAVLNTDSAERAASKIVAALNADANIAAFSRVVASGALVFWVKLAAAANDGTMNMAITAAGGTRFSSAANSTNSVQGNVFELSRTPRYAMLDETTNVYSQIDYGVTLPTDVPGTDPLITLAAVAGGVKAMLAATYGVRVVARSDAEMGVSSGAFTGGTGGFSQPSANYTVTLTAGQKIDLTFNKPMNVAEGQSAWDIYVTKYEDATSATVNSTVGPWSYYETVTAAELAAANSVSDGTASGLSWEFEYADGELGDLLTFDNFLPHHAEFVDLVATNAGYTAVFFSCLGRRDTVTKEGSSPGPAIVVGKPGNPEAVMRNVAVATYGSDQIVGVINARGRWWLPCENSLQTAILTGVDAAPVTIRSSWDVGFRNPYNLKFLKDYLFGFSTQGFLRSIGVGDTSDVDFEYSSPVDDWTTDWLCAHVLTDYDPKNKAVVHFLAGKERQSGYWVTIALPFLPSQGIWNPPIVLKKADGDFIVSGTATVGQSLYFVAGGRNSLGNIEVNTYEFDKEDGSEIDCYLAWAFSDMGSEDTPLRVKGVASLVGQMSDPVIEIHGVADEGNFDLAALETGHGIADQTITMPDGFISGSVGRQRQKRQSIPQFSKWTARLAFKSTDGSGRVDELNLLMNPNASRK